MQLYVDTVWKNKHDKSLCSRRVVSIGFGEKGGLPKGGSGVGMGARTSASATEFNKNLDAACENRRGEEPELRLPKINCMTSSNRPARLLNFGVGEGGCRPFRRMTEASLGTAYGLRSTRARPDLQATASAGWEYSVMLVVR